MRPVLLGIPLALVAFAAIATGPAPHAEACIWDDDTLAAEAKGLPSVAQILTGRFARNPPAYFERRLKLSAERIAKNADDFGAYDNAGVACDRLGRGDEAVAWMERKLARLDAAAPEAADLAEHRYRYHANLGTFLAHRWLRGGKNRGDLSDLQAGRAQIERAIELNADAHFGRERYQLRLMEWVIEGAAYPATGRNRRLPDCLGLSASQRTAIIPGELAKRGYADAVQGLTGLVVLGAAWESVDVMNAIALALDTDGHNSLALMARERMAELIAAGKGSIVPGSPRGDELLAATAPRWNLLREPAVVRVKAFYAQARAEADAWQEQRLEYVNAQLAKGRHPDTNPDFWDGFEPTTEAPALPDVVHNDPKNGGPAENGPAQDGARRRKGK